jgi:outer membrane protein OmpU
MEIYRQYARFIVRVSPDCSLRRCVELDAFDRPKKGFHDMKKFLLITSILAGTAGAASADVSVSGDARMGLASSNGGDTYAFSSRARVRFSLSAEADSGLKFAAQFRAADATKAVESDPTKEMAGTVSIEFPAVGKLTMGDSEGAAQAAVTQFVALGYNELDKYQEFAFLTGGSTSKGNDLLYTYANGPLSVSLSMGNPGAAESSVSAGSGYTTKDDRAIGVSYTTEFWKVAAGFEDNGVNQHTVLSGSYGNGQAEVKVAYGMKDDDTDQYVVYGTYILGLNTLTAFYREDFAEVANQGFSVQHDFGSGLAAHAGFARKEGLDSRMSLGVTMAF